MTKKDLIQLIKEKSDDIQIKDQSHLILERIKNLPIQQEVIEKPTRSWHLKPILLGSLSLLTTLIMVIIFISTFQTDPINPVNIELESYEDAIVLSSVSTTSLAGLIETELSMNMFTMMQASNEPMISQEIDALSRYLNMMEKLLSHDTSSDTFTVLPSERAQYQKHITFKTRDLLDQELSYEMDLNTRFTNDGHFITEGELLMDEKIYQVKMIGLKDDDSRLVYRLSKDDQNYIEVIYQIETDEMTAEVEIVKDGMQHERVFMSKSNAGTTETISIQFRNQTERGIYQFQKDIENEKPIMRVNYVIERDDIERGAIIIRINDEDNQYDMEITPQGKTPFVVNPGRRTMPNRGPFQ